MVKRKFHVKEGGTRGTFGKARAIALPNGYTPDHQAEIHNSSRPKIKTSDSAHMGMLPGTFLMCGWLVRAWVQG